MEWRSDLKSKLFDGLLPAFLITAILAGLIGLLFLARVGGTAGFVVYTIAAILVTGVCLRRSLKDDLSEVAGAWWGIIGGMAAWTVMELGEILGFAEVEDQEGVLMFLLVSIFVWLMWRHFPVGARFFVFIFLLNWGGHIIIHLQKYLSEFWEFFDITLSIYPWMALAAGVAVVYWIFSTSRTGIERLYAAGWLYLLFFTFIHMIFFY